MLETLQNLYNDFLAIFPSFLHPFVSIALAVLIIWSVVQVIKEHFVYLIVLVVLLPASIPIIKGLLSALFQFVTFLFGQ